MRPITSTLNFAEALRIVTDAARPIARTVTLLLLEADGRVVARDVRATTDVPPFDRAAMDGYAVIAGETTGASAGSPRTLRCVDRVFSGSMPARGLASGECMEIATGAPMPAGADAVVMVEETTRDGDRVHVASGVTPRQNIGRRGADLAAGDTIVSAGQVLTPSRIGALAATGVTRVDVFAKPTVALLSTGDEIVQPGAPLAPGQIYDINRFTLETIVARHGGHAIAMASAGDTIDALVDRLDEARHEDIVVFSGGSSVGDRDLILDAIARRGELTFRGIAVKPGMPKNGVVPLQRVHVRRAVLATNRAPPRLGAANDRCAARPPRHLSRGPAPVLHRARRQRPRRARVQGLGRHHEHGERGRLFRDSGRSRNHRGRHNRASQILLN